MKVIVKLLMHIRPCMRILHTP